MLATFYPKKILNVQIFAVNITGENKFRAKTFFETYLKDNDKELNSYNITYNSSYFTINKDTIDILILISDESFISEIIKNDFDKADKILFWTECAKANDLMKKFMQKIMVCNKKFDFLLTPRYFKMR